MVVFILIKVKYSYPLIVLGITDYFHPVKFIFKSHEEEQDYVNYFQSFIEICQEFKINFKPKFIIYDAWRASANSI